ncbi:1-acyl-sn-glycerol-3-phosphate acyltransferase [Salegentibacter sp. 24]|jgi:1-acyl-sn-glycerol-3-phosphate acyltransferase|uniref:lysophospholipid acyltransferase family protein n=1 Tax=Salegentibacter sp. 24 TaxID=2183986 RepID=UPI0010EA3DDA|nr:lysophospholipid acyltransferase family protein [Salegentibacter sp. 24]TDN87369.1 1-acyl-sn-glycerol-3-phosphate acyltransferase [Salegentibacter sp. 24]
MFPVLVVFSSAERLYPKYYVCARIWAKCILFGMGFYPEINRMQQLDPKKNYMLVANHTSMIDIMMMLVIIKQPFIFVGKKELARIPIFGFFYRKTNITVDRNCAKSKQDVVPEARRRLDMGESICIFPEGGVPSDRSLVLDSFKDGAFRLAIAHHIPIVPITFYDNKKRFSYKFVSGGPGKLRVKIHEFISTERMQSGDRKDLKNRTRQTILKELSEDLERKNPQI